VPSVLSPEQALGPKGHGRPLCVQRNVRAASYGESPGVAALRTKHFFEEACCRQLLVDWLGLAGVEEPIRTSTSVGRSGVQTHQGSQVFDRLATHRRESITLKSDS